MAVGQESGIARKRKHRVEFITKVAVAAVKEVYTMSELTSQFDVHPTQIHMGVTGRPLWCN